MSKKNKKKSIISPFLYCFLLLSLLTGCVKQIKPDAPVIDRKDVIEKQKLNPQDLFTFDLKKFIADSKLMLEYMAQKKQTNHNKQCVEDIRNNMNYYKKLISEAENIQNMMNTLQETEGMDDANKILIDQMNISLPVLFNLSQKRPSVSTCQPRQDNTVSTINDSEENKLITVEMLDLTSLFNKIRKDFTARNFENVIETYEEIEGQLAETDIPYKIRYSYGISLYENGNEDLALEKLKEMQKEPFLADLLSVYLGLGKWYIKNNKLDEAAETYKDTIYNILDLERLKEKAQKELAFIEKIKTPLENQLFSLIQKAETNIDERNLDEARKNCLNTLKIMTSNSLYNSEYYDRCDTIFTVIRAKEKETVDAMIDSSLNLADIERQFQAAKEPLQNYLKEHTDTDYKSEINSAISEIDKLEAIYANEECVSMIEKFKHKYKNECLPKIVQMDYEYALSCLGELVKKNDIECFASISEVKQIRKEAAKKIENLQSLYLKSQLEKAATLFARAQQSTTKNKKRENLVTSFFLLKKLTAQFPKGKFQKKISRYAAIVEKEIHENFPELLESE